MSLLVTFLLLWGLFLSPVAEAATYFETRPNLWAEVESLREPWANVTLTCQAPLLAMEFQLFKDGVLREEVNLDVVTSEYRFPLGAVTGDTRGRYRCRYNMGRSWTQLSNLVEVTGAAQNLPPPQLSSKPVPWIAPGLNTVLLCRGILRGATFILNREGDDEFVEVDDAPNDVEVSFPIQQAGNYTCTYLTHAEGSASEPSVTVTIEEPAVLPPPRLGDRGESDKGMVLSRGKEASIRCVAPLDGMEFQLRHGNEEVLVPRWSTYPDRTVFVMKDLASKDSGLYTCRYRMQGEDMPWSADSEPMELLVTDETLPPPELSAEPETLRPKPGALVQLRCRAPRPGLRFALVRQDADRRQVLGLQSPEGPEARFNLRDVSPMDSSNYSCFYVDPAPPFAGSAPSASLELHVDGPFPRPQLRPLWRGAVRPGHDAVLRCESHVPYFTVELLRAGEVVDSAFHPSTDLVLTYVGPQHAGNYSCRYRSRWPVSFVSELSDPVELQVAG